MQTQRHGKKPHPGPNLDPLDQNSDHLFFQKFTLVVTRIHGQLSLLYGQNKKN